MALTSLMLTILASVSAFGADTKFDPPAKPGQCYADVFSKQYLEGQSTDSETVFVCTYNCFDTLGKKHLVKAVGSANKLMAARDGSVMVCDGVRVVPKTMAGQQIWDFDGVDPFFAVMSSRRELRDWARSNKVQIGEEDLKVLRAQFFENVTAVGVAYYRAGNENEPMRLAALDLLEIGARTEKGRHLLQSAIMQLANSNGQIKTEHQFHALVLSTILAHGRFLIP